MNTRRLRIRVLTVLGLPALACTKPPPVDDAPQAVLLIPPIASASTSAAAEDAEDQDLFTHPAARAFDCGPGRSRAFVCGRSHGRGEKAAPRPYDQCAERATAVSTVVMVGRHPSPAPFDSALTARFRRHRKGEAQACCYSQCVDVDAVASSVALPPHFRKRLECITAMPRGANQPAPLRTDCPTAVRFEGGPDPTYAAPFDSEASTARTKWAQERTGFEDVNLCCYQSAAFRPMIRKGRALRDADGDVTFAPSRRSEHVAHPEVRRVWPDVDELDHGTRREIARRWTRDAELEHASVASFAHLSLALMALGAPPELVAAAHACALDEVRHAATCYAFASHYADASLRAGALAPPPMPTGDAVALAIETFRDGCIGETVAAAVAARSAAAAVADEVKRSLAAIAADEERHALFAWRVLRWTLSFDGVRDALGQELSRLDEMRGQAAASHVRMVRATDLGPLARHGLLSAAAEAATADEIADQVVLPCTRALLSA